jgi:UPF0755 protein
LLVCENYGYSILKICPDCELVRKRAKYLVGIRTYDLNNEKKREKEGDQVKGTNSIKIVDLDISSNTSLFKVATQLKEKKLIKSKWFFVFLALLKGKRKSIVPGEYRFFADMPTNKVIDHICGKNFVTHKITVPEGYTVGQIFKLLTAHKCLDGVITTSCAEGTLLPGTYYFSKNEKRETILARMKKAMTDLIDDIKITNELSKTNLVTLASIVEKETGKQSEVGIIAGVFLARLQKKMRLQADPTVIYGLLIKEEWPPSRVINRSDWKIDHPYNTYIHAGLPPTPICCPGKNTLTAVAKAKPGNSLYFVANKDGFHKFSETLKEHNRNIMNIKNSLKGTEN